MDISARTEYAIRAMLMLAEAAASEQGPVSVDALATRQELPRKFLEAIVSDLRRGGLVRSTRGAHGGYSLSRAPQEISLADVFRAVDGPLAEVRGLRPQETEYVGVAEHLPSVWVAVRTALRTVLDETSLEQVRTGTLAEHVQEMAQAPDAWSSR